MVIDHDPGFDLVSAGQDTEFDTDDDIRLTRLDRFWEAAIEDFERKADAFGERLEDLESRHWTIQLDERDTEHAEAEEPLDYETQALRDLLKEATETADKERAAAESDGPQ